MKLSRFPVRKRAQTFLENRNIVVLLNNIFFKFDDPDRGNLNCEDPDRLRGKDDRRTRFWDESNREGRNPLQPRDVQL